MTRTIIENEYYTDFEFTNKKVFDVMIPKKVTESMIESVIVNGFEGGIGYWCGHIGDFLSDGKSSVREGKPKNMAMSTWCTNLILEGKSIQLLVPDMDEKYYDLNLEGLKKGFTDYLQRRPQLDFDGDADAGDADCIIQIALFGEIVFG
jgi:hypothetical protein